MIQVETDIFPAINTMLSTTLLCINLVPSYFPSYNYGTLTFFIIVNDKPSSTPSEKEMKIKK